MNISQLQTLVAVVEQGNFSDAALHLHISQSAVSRAIASLEEELGVTLLVRGRFGAHPTPVGERLLRHVRKMLQLREQMDYEANLEKGLRGGSVRVAAFRSAATHLLPPVIARFRQQFPQITLTLTEEDPATVEQLLRSGQVDIGLLPLPRTAEDLQTWEIARDEFILLIPLSFGSLPETLTWADLSRFAYILYNYAECTTVVRNHWEAAQQTLKVAYLVKEDSTIVNMVAQGLGAAILPRLAAIPIPEGIQIRRLPIPLERVIGAAVLASALHPPAVFAFLEALRGNPSHSLG
jgi:DNA-binding transcriptional LysR family regulator